MFDVRNQGEGRGGVALGKKTKSSDTDGRGSARHGRYAAKRKAAELLREVAPKAAKRLSECGYRANDEVVSLKLSRRDKAAFVTGVMCCGSVWLCPNCALRISQQRKEELDGLLVAAKAAGKSIFLLTLTARHFRQDDVAVLRDQLRDALNHMRDGRAWRGLGVTGKGALAGAGTVTATEATHGWNGFHPHFHLIVIMAQPREEAERLLSGLRAEWHRSLATVGLDANEHGFQLQDGSAAGTYVSKFGAAEEMTLNTSKRGRKGSRTPWQLLEDARDGDAQAARAWVEYAEAFRGRRQLVWSKGLKAAYGIEELSDDEAAAAEEVERDIVVLKVWTVTEWKVARRRLCAILTAAESGGDLVAAETGPTDSERWRSQAVTVVD